MEKLSSFKAKIKGNCFTRDDVLWKSVLIMNAEKHILFLTPGFPKDEEDTACLTYFQNFIKAFVTQNETWKLTVISLHYPFEKKEYFWNGVAVIAMGGKNRHWLKKIALWDQVVRRVYSIHKKEKINFNSYFAVK